MALFKKAEQRAAFLKMGLMGFASSGKTHTASLVAIGLYKAAVKKKMPYAGRPIMMVDTEGGSDYIASLFDEAGAEFQVVRTRAFADLIAAIKEAEEAGSVLIIDSVTHFWTEWQESYKKAKGRKRGLEFQDWAEVKGQWRKNFTEPFINANLHIILCGRAKDNYDTYVDDAGKRQIEKSGVSMAAEKELGFEPSLLCYMEPIQDPDTHVVSRRVTIMKDRFRDLDGKVFVNPTFKTFVPHIEKLHWGEAQGGVDTKRHSEDMVQPDASDRSIERKIYLDKIADLLTKTFGTSREDKRQRIEILESVFGTSSETFLEKRCSLEDLIDGYDDLCMALARDVNDDISNVEFMKAKEDAA